MDGSLQFGSARARIATGRDSTAADIGVEEATEGDPMRQLGMVASTLDDVNRYGAPVTRHSLGAFRVEEKRIIRPNDQLHVTWVFS